MSKGVVFIVGTGDTLDQVARVHHPTVEAIWEDPRNARHVAQREDPAILIPGDEQAGMPWAFIRIRKAGEVDIRRVIPEVLPRSYVMEWAKREPNVNLQKTLENNKAEEDVKVIVGAEQKRRRNRGRR
ncbi:MAG: hypothetical protein AAF928_07815 [Myxococcota bacterium]